jgi:hypothetical protein
MRRIDKAWQYIPQARARSKVVLHYLAGKIEIDVFFPIQESVDVAHAESLALELWQALAPHVEFQKVRVYFG